MTNVLILGANGQIARNTTRVFLAHTDARLREIDAAASRGGRDIAFDDRSSLRPDERGQSREAVNGQTAPGHTEPEHLARRLAAVQPSRGRPIHGLSARRSVVSDQRIRTRLGRLRHVRAGRAFRMAHPPAGPDLDRHRGCWPGSTLGRADRGNPAWRRGLDTTRPEALARGLIQEQLDGKTADWLEQVSDAQYDPVQAPTASGTPDAVSASGAQTTPAQRLFGDIAPKLAELTDNVLFRDVWARPGLSRRDRSLVTVSALIAMNRPDQLRSHFALALQNGVTQDELVEVITHLAFYAGWPSAVSAASVAKEVFPKP